MSQPASRSWFEPVGWRTIVAVILFGAFVWRVLDGNGPLDFGVYRAAGMVVRAGRPLYIKGFGEAWGVWLPFTYPPIAAWLAVPFTWVSLPVGSVLWLSISVLTLAIALRSWFANTRVMERLGPLLLLAIAIWLAPVTDTLILGQVGIVLTVSCLADARRSRRTGGAVIGLWSAIKLTPLIFVPHFVWTRQWVKAAWVAVVFVGLTAIGWSLMPDAARTYFTDQMLDTERIGGTSFYANQSLLGTLTRLGLDRAVWFAVAGMVGVAGLWVAAAWHRAGNALAAATAVGLTSLLVSPISWQHHAIWILPALALLLGMRTRWADRVAAVCLAIEFLRLPSWADTWSVDGLVLSMVHGVFVNAGVICYALLLGTLAWAAPRKERLGLGDEVALVGSGR